MSSPERHFVRFRTVVAILFACAFLMRVLPYVLHVAAGLHLERAYAAFPWNFSPIYAVTIFAGTVLSARAAVALPLVVYAASDLAIAMMMGREWAFYPDQPFTYLAFALLALCGVPLKSRLGAAPVATAGIGGAVLFFLVTNVGVWLTGGGFARPHTPAGLAQCLIDALPFFTPTVASIAVFLPVLYFPLVREHAAHTAAEST